MGNNTTARILHSCTSNLPGESNIRFETFERIDTPSISVIIVLRNCPLNQINRILSMDEWDRKSNVASRFTTERGYMSVGCLEYGVVDPTSLEYGAGGI